MYPALRINLRAFLGKCSTSILDPQILNMFFILNFRCCPWTHCVSQVNIGWLRAPISDALHTHWFTLGSCITTLHHSLYLGILFLWLSGHPTFWLLFFSPGAAASAPMSSSSFLVRCARVCTWSPSSVMLSSLVISFKVFHKTCNWYLPPRHFLNIRLLYVILYLYLYLAPLGCLAHSSNSLSTSLKPPSKFILFIAFLSQAMTTPIPTVFSSLVY